MDIGLLALISVAAFILAAFYAGSETAIIASDAIRLRHLAEGGDKRAKLVLRYIDQPEHFLSVVLVGTNLGVIGCTSTFTAILLEVFGDAGSTIAPIILVPTLLIFEEILPKGIFLYYANRAAMLSIYPLQASAYILFPIIWFFAKFTAVLSRLFGIDKLDRKVTMSMEELLFHLRDSQQAGAISRDTMTLVSRAYDLMDFRARDVMVPLDKVRMVEDGLGWREYLEEIEKSQFSRFPVYRGDRQNVVGFITVRRVLNAQRPNADGVKMDAPYIVGVDTPIGEMMVRMKNQGSHMAMVRDTSGLVGMVTLEDILERLVGAIADEFH